MRAFAVALAIVLIGTVAVADAAGGFLGRPLDRYNRDGLRANTIVSGHGSRSSLDASLATIRGELRAVSFRAAGDIAARLPTLPAGAAIGRLALSGRSPAVYTVRVPARRSTAVVLLATGSVRVVLRSMSSPARSRPFLTVSGLPAGTTGQEVVLRRGTVRLARTGCPVRVRFTMYAVRRGVAPGSARTSQGC